MKWYLKVLKQYADFSGRAGRKELWIFVLFNGIFANAIMVLENVLGITAFDFGYVTMIFDSVLGTETPDLYGNMGFGWLYLTYNLAVLIPSLAVGVRRFHDTGKSGWNYFVGLIPLAGIIILLVWFCKDGQADENKWGTNPKN
jgi:uncharacterized membrane protein YhaH (DUF805 family)